jgi:aspartate 1-decarboxylase
VAETDLLRTGSATVDQGLPDAAGIPTGGPVSVVSVTSDPRPETCTAAGEHGSGVVGIDGAARTGRRGTWDRTVGARTGGPATAQRRVP